MNGRTEDVRRSHISAVLAFTEPQAKSPVLAGAHAVTGYGSEWRCCLAAHGWNWKRRRLESARVSLNTNTHAG